MVSEGAEAKSGVRWGGEPHLLDYFEEGPPVTSSQHGILWAVGIVILEVDYLVRKTNP